MSRESVKELLVLCIGLCVGVLIGVFLESSSLDNKKIVSKKPIEPYKVVLTKQDGRLIKTYHYKQQ